MLQWLHMSQYCFFFAAFTHIVGITVRTHARTHARTRPSGITVHTRAQAHVHTPTHAYTPTWSANQVWPCVGQARHQ